MLCCPSPCPRIGATMRSCSSPGSFPCTERNRSVSRQPLPFSLRNPLAERARRRPQAASLRSRGRGSSWVTALLRSRTGNWSWTAHEDPAGRPRRRRLRACRREPRESGRQDRDACHHRCPCSLEPDARDDHTRPEAARLFRRERGAQPRHRQIRRARHAQPGHSGRRPFLQRRTRHHHARARSHHGAALDHD